MRTGYFWTVKKGGYDLRKGYVEEITVSGGSINVGYDKRPDGWTVSEITTGLRIEDGFKSKSIASECAQKRSPEIFQAVKHPNSVKAADSLCRWSADHKADIIAAIETDKAAKVPANKYTGVHFPAAKRLCNAIVKSQFRPSMQGIFEQDGYFCLCDGYRALRFNQDIEELEHAKEDGAIDITSVIRSAMEYNTGDLLNLPTMEELKEFVRENNEAKKAGRGKRPLLVDEYIYVNPEYLLDFMRIFPGCKAYKPMNKTGPIYFLADGGDGILMPVRPPKTKEELAKEEQERKERGAEAEDCRKRIKEEQERREKEYREEQEQEEKEKNQEAEKQINAVIDVLRNGGECLVKPIETISGGHTTEKHVILRIAEMYGVSIPLRTQGWIKKSLGKIRVEDGRLTGYSVYRGHGKSGVIWDYINSIIAAILAEDASKEDDADDLTEDEFKHFFGEAQSDTSEDHQAEKSAETECGGENQDIHQKRFNGKNTAFNVPYINTRLSTGKPIYSSSESLTDRKEPHNTS